MQVAPKLKRWGIGIAVVGAVLLVLVVGTEDRAGTSGTPATCRVAVTADVLNVRAEPTPGAAVVGKFRQGAEADAEKVVQGGFRKLGEGRWVAAEFVTPLAGRECG